MPTWRKLRNDYSKCKRMGSCADEQGGFGDSASGSDTEMKYGCKPPSALPSMRRWSLQNASALMKHLPLSTAYWAK